MTISEWFQLLEAQLKETPLLQWVGVSFAVAEVLLARSNRIWLYPAGIISTVIATYTLFHAALYAESLLNIYYLVMTAYGWWSWDKRGGSALSITYSSWTEWKIALSITAAAFVLLFAVLKLYTPSTVPIWDAWVSASAWAGMWLLARRKIENWIFLNVSNAFAIPLLLRKDLPLYALLTIFLFVVAIQGYIKWRKIIRRQEASEQSAKPLTPLL
jgi:nicotinamide mononucleotide transporter